MRQNHITKEDQDGTISTAAFAAGCFWGVESSFAQLPGVLSTEVGYMGGHTANPSYEEVCTDTTGHAEAVRVEYDSRRISYEQLLKLFWEMHNPTTANRQGPDVGSQYRSAIFFYSEEQQRLAQESKAAIENSQKWGTRPIVTQILPATSWYRAEEYHQHYHAKRGARSCHV